MGRLQVISSILLYSALTLMHSSAQREYFIQSQNLTWSGARNYCQACFKELVTLTPDNIQGIARNITSDHWIGLRKNFNFNNNSINNLTSTRASYTESYGTTHYINSDFASNDTSSPFLNWIQWANGDPLAFQNWYPGWPLPKPHPKPPKKTLCCSCACTCPARTTTPAPTTTPATTPNTTNNITDTATSFTDLMENTDEITPQTSFSSVAGQTMTTQRTSSSFTTSAPWTTTEMPVQAECQRSVMLEPEEPEEPEDDDSNGANYIEDSCVAMLRFGPWIEKNCLDLLPFICYEDRFDGQVNVANKTSKGASLTWSPAPGDISSYRVEITEFINKNKTKEWIDTAHNLTYGFTNLTAGTNYSVKVFAVKCERDLNPARISFYTTPNKVSNLTITKVTESSVSLSWNKPDGNLDFYKLTYESLSLKWTMNSTEVTVATNNTEVHGLEAGTLYNFTIISGVSDSSTWSGSVSVSNYTNPDKVYNLAVSDNTYDSLRVTWDKPNGDFTDIIVRATNSSNFTLFERTVKNSPVTVTALPPGAEIHIFVTVRLNKTETRLGETQTTYNYTTPGLISNLILTSTADSIKAIWTPPNSSYTSFTITLYLNGQHNQTQTGISVTTVSFYSLKNAAKYTVEVRTVSGNLTSSSVNASIFTLPSPPTDAIATHIEKDSITFSWNAPANSLTSMYNVTLNSTFWDQRWSNQTSEKNYTFNDLKSGTYYSFEVRAMADGRQSDPATSVNCTEPDKREISLSMLCTSNSPLLCDATNTREDVFKQLKEFFSRLNGGIFWELEKTFK